jgi:serine/threonine protein kinase
MDSDSDSEEDPFHLNNTSLLTSSSKTCILLYNVPEDERRSYGNNNKAIFKIQMGLKSQLDKSESDILKSIKAYSNICPFTVKFYRDIYLFDYESRFIGGLAERISEFPKIDPAFKEKIDDNIVLSSSEKDPGYLAIFALEYMNGGEFTESYDIDYKTFKIAIFEMVYSLALFHKHTQNIHFDLKRANILVRKTKEKELFQIDVQGIKWQFETDFQACVWDFDISGTETARHFYRGTPMYEPNFYLMSIGLEFSQDKVYYIKRFQSRAYEDDIWNLGMVVLFSTICKSAGHDYEDRFNLLVPITSGVIELVYKKMYEIALKKRAFTRALNPTNSDKIFDSVKNFINDFIANSSRNDLFASQVRLTLQICIVQKIIGNGFLPIIPSQKSTLFKGLMHEAIESLESEILDLGANRMNELKTHIYAYGPELVSFMKKLLSWFPEQRAFFGRLNPGHFANVLKSPFFDDLKVKEFEESKESKGVHRIVVNEDLSPSPKLDFIDPAVLPYLKFESHIQCKSANLIGQSIMQHYKGDAKKLWLVKWGDNGYCTLIDADTKKPHCNHIVEESKQRHHLTDVYLADKDLCYACDFMK